MPGRRRSAAERELDSPLTRSGRATLEGPTFHAGRRRREDRDEQACGHIGRGAAIPAMCNAAEGLDLSPPARRLLAAADDLFYRHGAPGTTVREITAACGLTPGALYNHFSSKDELLYLLVVSRHRMLERELTDALVHAPDEPAAQLRAAVETYVRVHLQRLARRGTRVANREFRALGGAQLEEVVTIRRRLRDRVAAILLDGAQRGTFSICGGTGGGSVTVAAATILDMCVHAAEWVRPGEGLSLADLEERYVAMALRLAGARVAG